MLEHDCVAAPLDDDERVEALGDLRDILHEIEAHDDDYGHRYGLVLAALMIANLGGLQAGIQVDAAEPGWVVASIELPTGQVGWHMPIHAQPYDGHSTEEKYARVRKFIEEAA